MSEITHTGALPGNSTIREFENRMAGYCSSEFALSTCNASVGILGIFQALDLSGTEVVTTPFTWPGALSGLLALNCRIQFCDVEPETLTIDPRKLESVITRGTKAVFSADVLGYPARLDELRAICKKHNLFLIHDAASSFGSSYKGRFSGFDADVSILSFGAKKLFSTGEGGCIVTNQRRIYHALLRSLAHPERQNVELDTTNPFALNTRMNPLAAQYGLVTFERQLARIRKRQRLAQNTIRGLKISHASGSYSPNYYRILICPDDRNRIQSAFKIHLAEVPFSKVIYEEREFKGQLKGRAGICPVAEFAVKEYRVCLPQDLHATKTSAHFG